MKDQQRLHCGARYMKRVIAFVLVICGTIVVFETCVWLLAYFIERGLDAAALKRAFSTELSFWLPVILLGLPGILLIYYGRRMLSEQDQSPAASAEIVIAVVTVGIMAALVFPVDNFSRKAAEIVNDGLVASAPAQQAVEQHYLHHGRFPDSANDLEKRFSARPSNKHVRSISIGNHGRVVITFDTQDIDWGWSWWHALLFMASNDLTGTTLVVVPSVENGRIVWSACSEGTVPMRSRRFKCSRHG